MRVRCVSSAFAVIVVVLVAGSSFPESSSSVAVSVDCQSFGSMWSVRIANGSASTTNGTQKAVRTLSASEIAEVEDSLRSNDFWALKSYYPTMRICLDCLVCTVHAEQEGRSHASQYSPDLLADVPVEPSERREVERLVSVAAAALRVARSGLEPPQIRWRREQ